MSQQANPKYALSYVRRGLFAPNLVILANARIQESFVAGYRRVLWVAAALAVASVVSAAALVEPHPRIVPS